MGTEQDSPLTVFLTSFRSTRIPGMVNSTTDFEKHPFIINGCSELFVEVFGSENGIGVRSAVGVGSLPENVPVEIEAIFELLR